MTGLKMFANDIKFLDLRIPHSVTWYIALGYKLIWSTKQNLEY
jgi:hypothetical protein